MSKVILIAPLALLGLAFGCGGNSSANQGAGTPSGNNTKVVSSANAANQTVNVSPVNAPIPLATQFQSNSSAPQANSVAKLATPTPVNLNTVRPGPTPTPVIPMTGEINKMVAPPPDDRRAVSRKKIEAPMIKNRRRPGEKP